MITPLTYSRKIYDEGWKADNEKQLRRGIYRKFGEIDFQVVQSLMGDVRRRLHLVEEHGPFYFI